MSKMIFMKYIPAARDNLTFRLRLFRNSCFIFQVFQSRLRYLIKVSLNMSCQNWFPSLNLNLDFKM